MLQNIGNVRALLVEEAEKVGLTATESWLNKLEQVMLMTQVKFGRCSDHPQ